MYCSGCFYLDLVWCGLDRGKRTIKTINPKLCLNNQFNPLVLIKFRFHKCKCYALNLDLVSLLSGWRWNFHIFVLCGYLVWWCVVFVFCFFLKHLVKKAQTVLLHDVIPVTRPLLKSEISPCTIQQKTKSLTFCLWEVICKSSHSWNLCARSYLYIVIFTRMIFAVLNALNVSYFSLVMYS